MCQYLEPAIFMANVLSVRQEQAPIDFVDLRIIRDHVTEKLADRNVIIEWTRDAVMDAMHSYHDIFQTIDGKLTFRNNSDAGETDEIFNFGFTTEFLKAFQDAIKEVPLHSV